MSSGSGTTFYLPLREGSALGFLQEERVPDLGAERAGLFGLLLLVHRPDVSTKSLARAIHDAERTLATQTPAVVRNSLFAFCPPDSLVPAEIAALMERRGIAFVADETFQGMAWRGPDGRLSSDFQKACQETLLDYALPVFGGRRELDDPIPRKTVHASTDQVRALSAICADLGDRYAIDAYAGTGKTHLTFALFETGRRFTYLTPATAQREAFRQRGGRPGDAAITLAELAARMARSFVRAAGTRWMRAPRRLEGTRPVAEQAAMMGIEPIGRDGAHLVLGRALDAIRRWCHSDDRRIGYRHFRWPDDLPVAERAAYVARAVDVWEIMFSLDERQDRFGFPVRVYHLVKWLELVGADIPELGTLIIDEAHDLAAPWLSLLRRYTGGYVVMGDPYQHLGGGRTSRPHDAKSLGMLQSVRAGEQVMPIVRSVLRRYSEPLMPDDISGSRDRLTRHRLFGEKADLPTTGLRAYGSLWSMLEQALRLKDAGVPYRFVEASAIQLVRATQDAIQLRMHGDRPRHYSLRGFATWADFAAHLASSGHTKVVRLFERNFGHGNLQALMIGQRRGEGEVLTLGLLEDTRNLEFDTVTLSSCCFSRPPGSRPTEGMDQAVKAIYLAMTRVESELWLPHDWEDRLTDRSRQG